MSEKKLLIIEDDSDIAFFLFQAAKKRNLKAHIDSTGDEWLDDVDNFMPDIVLLDMNLPNMGGLNVLKRMKNRPDLRDVPVIVHSANEQKEVIDQAMSMGAAAYFIKGGDMKELFKTIDQHLENN